MIKKRELLSFLPLRQKALRDINRRLEALPLFVEINLLMNRLTLGAIKKAIIS